MARSLEGKQFHFWQNGGVCAVTTDQIFENLQQKTRIIDRLPTVSRKGGQDEDPLPHIIDTPVFTFTNRKRLAESPWFTGTYIPHTEPNGENDLDSLTHYVRENGGAWRRSNFYVPFSNGDEIAHHGRKAQLQELRFVTTNAQFEEVFGISLSELRSQGYIYYA